MKKPLTKPAPEEAAVPDALTALVGLLTVASGSWLANHLTLKPLRGVVETANKVASGDLTSLVKVDGKDIALEPQPNGFITKDPLQAKEPAPIVVQIRASAVAKPTNFRLTLNTSLCGECKRQEYGCTCAH